jgi:PPOX class probable F420-dependent enzyme
MTHNQGDVSLLQDPIAQSLLQSRIPARLAYIWPDGTPRVVPVWFHWDGREFVFATPPTAPKVRALSQNPAVALTVDEDSFPPRVLLVRGIARTDLVNGIVPEYAEAARRYLGEEQGAVWAEQMMNMFSQVVRVSIRPEWVGIFDFQQRFPSAIERAMWGEARESDHAR